MVKSIVVIILLLTLNFSSFEDKIPDYLKENEKVVNVDFFNVYGKSFNIEGSFEDGGNVIDLNLVLEGEVKYSFPLKYKIENGKINYQLNKNINEGINLEEITPGTYQVILEIFHSDTPVKASLVNANDVADVEYYTFNNDGLSNKIVTISKDKSFFLSVVEGVTPNNVFDIVIDPGHGGSDTGPVIDGYAEKDFNLKYALDLEVKLSALGYKVKLTRYDNEVNIPTYGLNSRVGMPYETKAKIFLSLHFNNIVSEQRFYGTEIYAAPNLNLDFAKKLADNIVEYGNGSYSPSQFSKVMNGVYVRNFKSYQIDEFRKMFDEKNTPFYESISTSTPYYFVIRETGGLMTGAYVDGRDDRYDENPYYRSNIAAEAYLIEYAYMSDPSDLNKIINNMDGFNKGVIESIINY